ncbi:MAG: sigma-70 family RNA polymerase sigma factor [Pseudonocardiaceae bacterium]
MDQREWGQLRETVLRRTRASGASREDAEDATHDALLAAIGQPEHPQSEVAWLSTVAKRRRVDLIRQRVREQRVPGSAPGASDPTAAGPEDVVVDRAHASWLAASLTQLPPTTREVVDAVGSGMAPSEVASSMNLSPRSVESHLTRARRHLRRMGALGIPLAAVLGWALRTRPGSRVAPAALAVAVPVVVAVVALLPSSKPMDEQIGAGPVAPATAVPVPIEIAPEPQSVPVPAAPETGPLEVETEEAQPAAVVEESGTAESVEGVDRTGESGARPSPAGRSLPPEPCPLNLPLVGDLGCVLVNLIDGVTGGLVDTGSPLRSPLSGG